MRWDQCPYKYSTLDLSLSLSPRSMRTQGESGLLQARGRLSLDTEHAGTFSFNLEPPELC